MGFTSILIDDRDRTGKKVDNNVRKIAKKTKVIITDLTRKSSSPFSSQFHWRKNYGGVKFIMIFFWCFLIAAGKKNAANKLGYFFTSSFRSFFFPSLAISAHCSLLDLLINIIWNFIITILKHILHYVQVVGIVSFFQISVFKCLWV